MQCIPMPGTVVFVPVICVTHFSTRNNEKAAGWCTRVEQVEEGRERHKGPSGIKSIISVLSFSIAVKHSSTTIFLRGFSCTSSKHFAIVIKLFSEASCPNFAATLGANGTELSWRNGEPVTLSGGRSRDLA